MDRVFAYQAIAPDGSLTGGTIDADDVAHARSVVASRGMFVVSIAARGTRRARRDPLSPADLALGLRILGDLLESGLPVARALHGEGEGGRGAIDIDRVPGAGPAAAGKRERQAGAEPQQRAAIRSRE